MIRAAQEVPGQPPFQSPWRSIGQMLADRAAEAPEADCLIAYDAAGGRHAYSRGALLHRVRRMAGFLAASGIRRGDRVATLLHNHREAVFLMLAAWWMGAVAVPINTEESPARKRFILQDAGARLLVALPHYLPEILDHRHELPDLRTVIAVEGPAPDGVPLLADVLPQADGEPGDGQAELAPDGQEDGRGGPASGALSDEALIVYTSGTTGNPKGVVLSQQNLLADATAIVNWFDLAPGERWMCVLPVHHVNGIVVTLLSPLVGGGVTVLNPRFSVQTFWSRALSERVAVCSLVPTLLEFLLEAAGDGGGTAGGGSAARTTGAGSAAGMDGASDSAGAVGDHDGTDAAPARPHRLRGVICGAGPLLSDTVLRFERRFGIPVWHGYGLSETTAYACMTPLDLPDEVRRHWYSAHGVPTIGTAMDFQALSIRDRNGEALPPGERGEICIRGATVMQGYLGRDDANADAFRFEGWFRSGDEGFWMPGPDGRPFFFITGRIKELIIRGGVNLSPLEIDAVLAQHPAVRFGMAVPFENRYYGEEVAAYVVPREGYEPGDSLAEDIRRFAAGRLPFPMQPKVVLFGTEVPYTTTGKPKRLAIRDRLAEQLARYREVQFREGGQHGG